MKRILQVLFIFLLLIFTSSEKQYSSEETQNLLQEYLLMIVADMQDLQLNKITVTQFYENININLQKIDDVIRNSTFSEAEKRVIRNEIEILLKQIEMYAELLKESSE
jgi:hypothetical protein